MLVSPRPSCLVRRSFTKPGGMKINIRVAPEFCDAGGLASPYHGLLDGKHICRGDRKRKKLRMMIPYMIYVVRVELRRDANLLRFPHHRDRDHTLLLES
jgi:hypothetical protein